MNAHRIGLGLLAGIVGVSACGGEPAPEPTPAPAQTGGAETTSQEMWHHFRDASEAFEAVIAGNLEGVRAPLQRLSAEAPAADAPADWAPWIEDMQKQAAQGAQATDLPAAAAAVAALGAACGDCHRTTRGGPEFTGDEAGYSHYGRTGLKETMARHLWSANELWLGLTGPVHEAWSRGAAALMNIEVPKVVTPKGTPADEDKPPSGEGTLQTEEGAKAPEGSKERASAAPPKSAPETVDLDAALHDLQALGARADKAGIPQEKQAVFADVIARCGSCHSYLGIEVKPAQ